MSSRVATSFTLASFVTCLGLFTLGCAAPDEDDSSSGDSQLSGPPASAVEKSEREEKERRDEAFLDELPAMQRAVFEAYGVEDGSNVKKEDDFDPSRCSAYPKGSPSFRWEVKDHKDLYDRYFMLEFSTDVRIVQKRASDNKRWDVMFLVRPLRGIERPLPRFCNLEHESYRELLVCHGAADGEDLRPEQCGL